MWQVSTGKEVSGPHGSANSLRLVLILSTHVDDLKGAGEEEYRIRLLKRFETEFSTLKVKHGSFECVGVMHEQDTHAFE